MLGLHCDGPSCREVVTDDAESQSWWVLGRNSGGIYGAVSGFIASTVNVHVDIDMDGDIDGDDEVERTKFDTDAAPLHFCCDACLAQWAVLARKVNG